MKRSLDLARMNLRVGLMSVAAFAVLVWVLFFPVRGVSPFSSKIRVIGYYDRVDGLRRNAPVYYRGIEVGSVQSVEVVEGSGGPPLKVVVSVEKRVVHLLPKGTVLEIVARGLLGDVFVDLVPPDDPSGPRLADGDVCPTKPYESVLTNMNALSGEVKVALAEIKNLLRRAQSPETSVGRLFREDRLYEELVRTVKEFGRVAERLAQIERDINEKILDKATKESVDKAVASARRVLDRADELTKKATDIRWHLTIGMNKYEGALYSGAAGLTIIPNKDKFYQGGIEWFNAKQNNTAAAALAGGYAGYYAYLGLRVLDSPIFFRGGLKRTFVGAGLDLRVDDLLKSLPLELSADAYKFGQPTAQFDLGAKLSLLNVFRLGGGVEDVLNTPRYYGGLTLLYDDQDLTSILVKSQSGL